MAKKATATKAEPKLNLKPLDDRVIIRPDAASNVSQGGILLPENGREKPQRGVVVAVGPGKRSDSGAVIPMQTKVGDRVVFARYAGANIPDLDDVAILREDDILAVITDD